MLKKIMFLIVLMSGSAGAFDTRSNPDQFSSVGVDLIKMQQGGIPRAGVNGNSTDAQGVGFRADYRLPVTNAFTFHVAAETISIDNNLAYTDAYRIEVGGRVYFLGK